MDHEYFMKRCFQLAAQGIAGARPNPMVGSVIVHNGSVIGEGFHRKYGEAHAEVNAVNAVSDHLLLKQSTIYVSLEPCSHFGKTPPCADLIIAKGIPRVIISCVDTFSEVAGRGIQRLKDAGVEVITGILEKEGRELNKRFFCYHEEKRPYIVLKWARTQDGFIDKDRKPGETGVNRITNDYTRQLVHKWRSEEMAILTGYKTWITDKPSLTVRDWEGQHPRRIIWSDRVNSLIPEGLSEKDLFVSGDLEHLMHCCYEQGIQSILVEGGAKTIQAFLNRNLWDEARVLTGAVKFGAGLKAPEITGGGASQTLIGGNTLTTYKH